VTIYPVGVAPPAADFTQFLPQLHALRLNDPSLKQLPFLSAAGVLALPVAEFLAVKHGTSYLGYSQQSSKGAAHPFFASRLHKHSEQHAMRSTGADAADADAEQAGGAAGGAAATPGAEGLVRTGSGAAPGSGRKQQPLRSPRGQDPEASEDVPLITCSSSATLLEVGCRCCEFTWNLLINAVHAGESSC
jgi:hypothetical protein